MTSLNPHKEMESHVKRRFDPKDPVSSKIYQKEYHMLSPNGEIILPETWNRLVKPDWVVEMRLSSSLGEDKSWFRGRKSRYDDSD